VKKLPSLAITGAALAIVNAVVRALASINRPDLIINIGILFTNALTALSTAGMIAGIAMFLIGLCKWTFENVQDKRKEQAERDFVAEMMQSTATEDEGEKIKARLIAQARANPNLAEMLGHGVEQLEFIDELISDFDSIFAGLHDSGGVKETIMVELEKDRHSVIDCLRDVLRWVPSRSVRSHYEDYIANMQANLDENDAILNRYDELRYVTLQYLENKGARPDRTIGIDSLYEAIKTLTEREKITSFPQSGSQQGGL